MKTNMAAAMVNLPTSLPPPSQLAIHDRFCPTTIPKTRITFTYSNPRSYKSIGFASITCCLNLTTEASTISSLDEASTPPKELPPVKKRRRVFRKQHPGEAEGITEEMRFVAMRLRKTKAEIKANESDEGKDTPEISAEGSGNSGRQIDGSDDDDSLTNNEKPDEDDGGRWEPALTGFTKYLVDSKLVFDTIERLVDESQDVSFAYFRNTGLERSESFEKDLQWVSQRVVKIPEPQDLTKKYVKHLEQLAAESHPLFFCHLYNIYFSHIAGGQVIAKKVSEKILEGRELEICRWPGDPEELLKGVREKLNALGQHWSRDVKNQCLKSTNRAFMSMGAIIRLICAG